MTVEYILLLAVSAVLILNDFVTDGPVQMMGQNGPRLAMHVEKALVTGGGFQRGRTKTTDNSPSHLDWRRCENPSECS